MKGPTILILCAVLYTSIVFSGDVSAQVRTLVQIKNTSGHKMKICMYKDEDQARVVPFRCFKLNNEETVMWNRAEDFDKYFYVKVFQDQLAVDKYLYTRHLPSYTRFVKIGMGAHLVFSQAEVKPITKYILKVCNQRFDQKIFFALGFETNNFFVTEGWWSVDKGRCIDIGVSERLKQTIDLEYGNLPQTYYYAEAYGHNPLSWTGGPSGLPLCVNEREAFKIRLARAGVGNPMSGACNQYGQKEVSFRRVKSPKTNEEYYYLNF